MINIKGIEKSMLLHQLWRFAKAQGMSFMSLPTEHINDDTFKEIIKERQSEGLNLRFDYLMGKVMKCDITGDELNPRLYDRDNGRGKAERVVKLIREENK